MPNKITQQQNEMLTKQINVNKIEKAIFQMENQKSLGIDSLPIEYKKEFYEYLKDDLSKRFNMLLTEEQSLKTMNQAIITLVPKSSAVSDPFNSVPLPPLDGLLPAPPICKFFSSENLSFSEF